MAIQLEFQNNSKKTQEDLEKLRQSVEGINKSVNNTSNSLKNFATNLAITVGSLATTGVITATIDNITRLDTKMKLATSSIDEYNKALKYTKDVALSTRAPLSDISTLYQKIAMNSEDLKASQTEIAVVTQTVAKSLAVSNATAAETSAVILQLGQALAAGVLRGDELRSVMEGAPALAAALAKGLGVSVGQMKILGEQGKLTSRDVFQALLRSTSLINDQFKKVGITYSQAFTNIGNSITLLLMAMNKAAGNKAGGPATFLNNIAIGIAKFADNFEDIILRSKMKFYLFIFDIVDAFTELPKLVTEKIKLLFNTFDQVFNIKLKIQKLNIKDFFVDLEPVATVVSKWVHTMEGYFAWLYDKVIGHSWIPDLVMGVITWVEKLKGAPVNAIREFATSANSIFASLNNTIIGKLLTKFSLTTVIISAATSLEKALGSTLAKIIVNAFIFAFSAVSVVSLISAVINATSDKSLIKSLGDKLGSIYDSLGDSTKSLGDKLKGFISISYNKLLAFISSLSVVNKLKDWWNKSMFGYNVRQALGMKETYYNKDPNDYVGRGPLRDRPNRPPLHDLINMFPTTWQVPILVGLGTVVALAIVKIFEASTFRSALFSILTTIIGYGIARLVDKQVVNDFTNAVGWGIVQVVQKGLQTVFSFAGDTGFKDPFGFLSLIFKLSLLFAAGRDFAKNVAIGAATAPARAVNAIGTQIEQRNVAKSLSNIEDKLVQTQSRMAQLDRKASMPSAVNNPALWNAITTLSKSVNEKGQGLTRDQIAKIMVNNKLPKGYEFSGSAATDINNLARAWNNSSVKQRLAILDLNNSFINATKSMADLNRQREATDRSNKALIKQVETTSREFRAGILNTSSAIGGIFGSYAGLNIGTKIADGMVGYPDWAKIGVSIGGAILGQSVIAGFFRGATAFGLAIGTAVLSALSPVGVIIATAIGAVLFFLVNPKAWAAVQAVLEDAILIFEPILQGWWNSLKKWWNETGGNLEWWYKVGEQIKAGITAVNTNIVDPLRDKYPAYDKTVTGVTSLVEAALNNTSTDKVPANQSFMSPEDMQQWWADNKSPRGPLDAYSQAQDTAAASRNIFYNKLFDGFKEYILNPIGGFITDFISYRPTQNKASGGMIYGPGSGTSDSIPAMLSNGEFVVNAQSTKKNRKLLESINKGLLPGFASGGLVSFNGDTITGNRSVILEYDKLFKKTFTPYYEDQVYRKYGDQSASKYPTLIKENIDKLPNKLVKDNAFKKTLQDHIDSLINTRGGVKNLLSEDETLDARMHIVQGDVLIPDLFNNKYPDMAYGISLHEIGHLDDVVRNGWKGIPSFKDIRENTTAEERYIVESLRMRKNPTTINIPPAPAPAPSWIPPIVRSSIDKLSSKSTDIYDWKTHIEALNKDNPGRFDKIYPYLDRYDNNVLAATNMTNKGRFAAEQYANEFAYINSKIKSKEFFTALSLSMRSYINKLDAEDQLKVDAATYKRAIELAMGTESNGEILFSKGVPSYNKLLDTKFVGKDKEMLGSGGKINLFNMKDIPIGAEQISNESWEFDRLINMNKANLLKSPYWNKVADQLDTKEKQQFILMYYDTIKSLLKKVYKTTKDIGIFELYRETWEKIYEEITTNFTDNMSRKDFIYPDISDKVMNAAKQYFPLIGYASGGAIQGPGSGTSDSILARVSNGEFIVNAQATKKNRALLDLINSNQLPKFANGTEAATNVRATLDAMAQSLTNDNERLKVFLDLLTKLEGVKFGFNTGYGNNYISDLSQHPYPARYLGIKTGLPATNEEVRQGMTTSAAGAFQFQRDTWNEYMKKLNLPDFSGESQIKAATQLIKDLGAMSDVMSGNFSKAIDKLGTIWASLPSSTANQPKKTWDDVVNLAQSAERHVRRNTSIIVKDTQEASTEIGKALQELVKDIQGINSLADFQAVLRKYMNKIGGEKYAKPVYSEDVFPKSYFIKTHDDIANSYKDILTYFTGLSVSGEQLKSFSESQISSLESLTDSVLDAERKYLAAQTGGDKIKTLLSRDSRVKELKEFLKSADPANLSFREKLEKLKSSEDSFNYINEYLQKLVGTTIAAEQFKNNDNSRMIDNIINYLNDIDKFNKVLNSNEAPAWQKQMAKSGINEMEQAIKKNLKEMQGGISETLKKMGLSSEARQAGIAYASKFENELSDVIANVLKGKMKGKDAMYALLDSFTGSIVDNLAKSFTTSLMKNSGFDKVLSTVIGGVYDLGTMMSEKLFPPEKRPNVTPDNPLNTSALNLNNAATALTNAANSISTAAGFKMNSGSSFDQGAPGFSPDNFKSDNPFPVDLSGATPDPASLTVGKEGIASNATMAGVGMMIGSSITALGAMIGGKTGQIISILGMVVNAVMMVAMISAMPGFKALGGAFTKGIQTFATGGVFNSPHSFQMAGGLGVLGEAGPEAIMPLTRLPGGKLGVKAVGSRGQSNATFNINITGDVSRQTRTEIQRMIPQIASGVNQHNYDQGYYRK